MSVKSAAMPHDGLFRTLMRREAYAKEIIQTIIPRQLRHKVDWNYLQYQPQSFVDDELKQSICDMLIETRFDGDEGFFYLLIEHQSQPDRMMPLRILEYSLRIMREHYEQNKSKSKSLPLVIPLLFYTGEKQYPYSNDLKTMIDASEAMIESFHLQPFQIIDVMRLSNEQLRASVRLKCLQLLMSQQYRSDQGVDPELIVFLRSIERYDPDGIMEVSISYLFEVLSTGDRDALVKEYIETLSEGGDIMRDEDWRMEDGRITLANYLRREGWRKGKEEGMQEGMQEGHQEGLQEGWRDCMLQIARNMLEKNFELSKVVELTGISEHELRALSKRFVN